MEDQNPSSNPNFDSPKQIYHYSKNRAEIRPNENPPEEPPRKPPKERKKPKRLIRFARVLFIFCNAYLFAHGFVFKTTIPPALLYILSALIFTAFCTLLRAWRKKGKVIAASFFAINVALIAVFFYICPFRLHKLPDGTCEIDGLRVQRISLEIPPSILGTPVTAVGGIPFTVKIERATISEGVTHITDHAFYDCDDLTNVTIPDSVTFIGDMAFYSCDSLTNITLPEGVTYISEEAFAFCVSLTSIQYSGTMTEWESIEKGNHWNEGSAITSIVCSDGVISLK